MPLEIIQPASYRKSETPHRRIRWAPASDDLHLNLVDLRACEEIGEHVNDALDVVLTCLDGSGTLTVDDQQAPLEPGSIAVIPKGSYRAVTAGESGIRYTTCHQRRGGLMPTIGSRQ